MASSAATSPGVASCVGERVEAGFAQRALEFVDDAARRACATFLGERRREVEEIRASLALVGEHLRLGGADPGLDVALGPRLGQLRELRLDRARSTPQSMRSTGRSGSGK